MVLIAFVIARIPFVRSNSRKTLLPVGACMLLGVGMLILTTQRQLFALHPSRNYYHWLVIDESIRNSSLPKVYAGDHLYFPNHYSKVKNANIQLIVPSEKLKEVYRRFNSSITTQSAPEFDLQSYILIMDRKLNSANHILPPGHANVTFDKITGTNGLINAYKIKITETKPE